MCEKHEKSPSFKTIVKNKKSISSLNEKGQLKQLGLTEKGLSRLLKDVLK